MAEYGGVRYTRAELEGLVGKMDQVAGVTLADLSDGRARGCRIAEVRTGSGFSFTVNLDRAMDIVRADFRGRSLCWRSVAGDVHPAYYEPEGLAWLRGFAGGLLTTCGLTHYGAPCEDRGEALGLHGRIGNTPAEKVSVSEGWKGNDYMISLSGEMREGYLFGACFRLRRTMTTSLNAKSVKICDEVTNIGPRPAPLMLLYHVNLGFPALGPEARLLAPSRTVKPNTPRAAEGMRNYTRAEEPQTGFDEQVYEHTLRSRRNRTTVALVNPTVGEGFGVYERFRTDQLPVFTQWKMMGRSEYVMGLEPGTNGVTGRPDERRKKRLITLRPGRSRSFELELGVLDGAAEIRAILKEVRAITGGRRPQILDLET